jgi:hypothetical protein
VSSTRVGHFDRRQVASARWGLLGLLLGELLGELLGLSPALWAAQVIQPPPPPTESADTLCQQALAPLIDRLLLDLPSYMNRVRIRSGISKSYIVLAGRPELAPLQLPPGSVASPDTKQVFFTVLQRRYERDRIVYLQEYHWLFLAKTPKDWRFALLYSTFGPYPATPAQPPLPPRISSDSSAGVAIRDWLIDCRAGQLLPHRGFFGQKGPIPSKLP